MIKLFLGLLVLINDSFSIAARKDSADPQSKSDSADPQSKSDFAATSRTLKILTKSHLMLWRIFGILPRSNLCILHQKWAHHDTSLIWVNIIETIQLLETT